MKLPATPTPVRKSPRQAMKKSTKSPKKAPSAKSPKNVAVDEILKSPKTPAREQSAPIACFSDSSSIRKNRLRKRSIPRPVLVALPAAESNLSTAMKTKKAKETEDGTDDTGRGTKRPREPVRRSKRGGKANSARASGGSTAGKAGSSNVASSSTQTVIDVDEQEEIGHLCPTEKVQNVIWSTPFLLLLDAICACSTDLQETYKSFLPPATELQSNRARNSKYGMMERALGKTLSELQYYLTMEIDTQTTARANVEVFRKAKKDFEEKYIEGIELMRAIRTAIGSQPSIYWYFCSETIVRIITQVTAGMFTLAADELHNNILLQYICEEYPAHVDQAERFLNILHIVSQSENFSVPLKEHTCRLFWQTPYETGVKASRDNTREQHNHESPRTYYLRKSCKRTDIGYRNCLKEVQGFRITIGENDEGIRELPISDLTSELIGYCDSFMKPELIHGATLTACGLCFEIDAAMTMAEMTEQPAEDNEEDQAVRIYGHSEGNEYHIKPWSNMAQFSMFMEQLESVRRAIGGGNVGGDDDVQNFGELLVFHALVQDFSNLCANPHRGIESILQTRMQMYMK